ncbi:MAG: hypothetical protein GYB66_11560 [Chloroflexi bacterium]|nr:hypothetical protein [Chloroflexota bacterium]
MAELNDYPEPLREIMGIFAEVPESERLEMLVDYSSRFREVPNHIATRPFPEEQRVQRCESEAYVFVEPTTEGQMNFYFAVENPQGVSARALGAILQESLSGADVDTIEAIPTDIVTRLFGPRISMGKGEGLLGMVALLKYFARQHKNKQA